MLVATKRLLEEKGLNYLDLYGVVVLYYGVFSQLRQPKRSIRDGHGDCGATLVELLDFGRRL